MPQYHHIGVVPKYPRSTSRPYRYPKHVHHEVIHHELCILPFSPLRHWNASQTESTHRRLASKIQLAGTGRKNHLVIVLFLLNTQKPPRIIDLNDSLTTSSPKPLRERTDSTKIVKWKNTSYFRYQDNGKIVQSQKMAVLNIVRFFVARNFLLLLSICQG
jgi:hypothetical protein